MKVQEKIEGFFSSSHKLPLNGNRNFLYFFLPYKSKFTKIDNAAYEKCLASRVWSRPVTI